MTQIIGLLDQGKGADARSGQEKVVARLKQAGAIILGKHALYEFCYGGPSFDLPWPPARNPWDM